jgi:hypothetical protein
VAQDPAASAFRRFGSSWGESFVLFETPNPEMPIAPRTGPVVLASGRKGAGLEEGRLCLWKISAVHPKDACRKI